MIYLHITLDVILFSAVSKYFVFSLSLSNECQCLKYVSAAHVLK